MFNGYRVPVKDDEKVLEMGSSDGCTTIWIHVMPLNYTPKNDKSGEIYVMYILPHLDI